MRITHHGEYLVQLNGTAVLFPVNCYFVRETDGLTLIDTGMPYFTAGIQHAARRLGAPIVRIALTHTHSDHIGALDALHTALPQAEVLFTQREVRILDGDRALDADEAQAPIKGSFPKVTTRPTRLIVPGDRVGSLEVIAAPGPLGRSPSVTRAMARSSLAMRWRHGAVRQWQASAVLSFPS